MKNHYEAHQLLILSKDSIVYKQTIEQAGFSNLSILAVDEPGEAIRFGGESDLLFGDPSLACQVINLIPSIRWYQSSWAGIEALVLPGMRTDYLLTNARNVYGEMMSEYVFGYLLMIERQILPRWQSQLKHIWDERPSGTLKGKWIGLLGVGSIGSHLAITAHHLGMHVLGYTRISESCTNVDQYFHGNEILDFVSKLDYLVCSLPYTPTTKGMINANLLSYIPTKAWLINIGRGSTVDETALREALNYGKIAGAVLDVFDVEPLPDGHPFWDTPNTYITSHTAAKNYLPDIADLFIENYKLFINGKSLKYLVNFEQHY
jgi:phosphoglycerate dehydrogenase-like enzyme